MSLERLRGSLADRHRLDREFGQACPERIRGGGMATGYLAQNLRHQRTAAPEVFNPALAALFNG